MEGMKPSTPSTSRVETGKGDAVKAQLVALMIAMSAVTGAGCKQDYQIAERDEVVVPQCGDGEDNDNDGKPDTLDPDCENAYDMTESVVYDVVTECNDGIDNDGDGWIDYGNPSAGDYGDGGCYSCVEGADGITRPIGNPYRDDESSDLPNCDEMDTGLQN